MSRQKSCDNVVLKPIIKQPLQSISPRYQQQTVIQSNGQYTILNTTSMNDTLTLKPHKKFSLNCKISCILSLTSQLFIFTSVSESTFKVFDIINNIVVNETISPSPTF